ncbi:LITAF domain-containing protein-like [Saccostrea echinata]|uniref:LITAF domain-containing protein-like n=1 Tax=Saccostrea echinata TaxID=191078 RepID=UPI002A8048AE|nr:LITAF domain-containing protein-like [Saccostrea echinata]
MDQPPPPPQYSNPGSVPGQPPPPPGGNTVVYTQQPTFFNSMMFREFPVAMTCTYCQATITTTTRYETGTFTWVACGVIAFIGCWMGCCLIPFCIDGCKDVVHSCPSCRQTLGKYSKM